MTVSAENLTSQESVELDKKLEVHIVALGCFAVTAPDMMGIQIDTWRKVMSVPY